MWLSDVHFLVGEMDQYLPHIYGRLPDAKVYLFPTTRVATSARSDTHNRMGGTLALVTHRWKAFTTHTYTDPIGLGIVNALYFKVNGLHICSINAYCLPSTHSDGPATLYARVKRFLDHPSTSPRLRHLTPSLAVYTFIQKLITKARLRDYTTFIHGDFNAPILTPSYSSQLTQWMSTNSLQCPTDSAFKLEPSYFTRRGNDRHKDTVIDHIMHTALPPYLTIHQVGTINNYEVAATSDHLPQWLKIAISIYIPRVPKRLSVRLAARIDIRSGDLSAVDNYNAKLLHVISQHKSADRASPNQSGQIVAAICRASVEAVKDALLVSKKSSGSIRGGRRSKYKKGYSTAMHIR